MISRAIGKIFSSSETCDQKRLRGFAGSCVALRTCPATVLGALPFVSSVGDA